MSNHLILEALQKRLTEAVAASSEPDTPVKYMGIAQDRSNLSKWVEAVFIPNNPDGVFWGSEEEFRGIFRIIISKTMDGRAPYDIMKYADELGKFFNKGQKFSFDEFAVMVYDKPKLMTISEVAPNISVSISVRYTGIKQ